MIIKTRTPNDNEINMRRLTSQSRYSAVLQRDRPEARRDTRPYFLDLSETLLLWIIPENTVRFNNKTCTE